VSFVLGVSSAQAVSLPIPNSGFETPCGAPGPPFPCNWGGTSGSTISWNTAFHHNGVASLALSSIGTPGINAISSCITPASGLTAYNLEFWYRTTFQSVKVILSFSCPPATCAANLAVYFDDVVAQTQPLAVTVASLSARSAAQGVLLRWRTGTEVDLLGFQVYRSRGHSWQRITHSLIAAKGSVSGASYRFLDRTARRGPLVPLPDQGRQPRRYDELVRPGARDVGARLRMSRE
jgi:hypothetical protein